MLDIFGITITVYLFLCVIGWGTGLLLLPEELRKYQLWLAPWLGMIVSGMSCIWLSRLGLGTEVSLYFTLLVGIIAIGFCRLKGMKMMPSLGIEDAMMAAGVVISFYLALSPLLTVDGFPTTISMGNSDPQNYALLGDFLKTHGIYQKPTAVETQPNASMIAVLLGPGVRPSCWLLYSLLSSLVHRQTHEIFTISLDIFFALTPPLIFIFTRIASRNRPAAGIALLISALNINFLYFNYHGFGAQIPAQGLLIFAFLLLYLINFNSSRHRKFIFLIAIIISTFFTFYIEIIPFFVLPLLTYVGFILCSQFQEKLSNIQKSLKGILTLLIVSIVIDPIAVKEGLPALSQISSAAVGWPMLRWAMPSDILGFFNVYPGSQDQSTFWPFITSLPIIGCIFVGTRSMKNQSFTISYLTFTIGILLYLRYVRGYSYGYHKAMAFSLFFLIVIFSSGLTVTIQKIVRYFKWKTTQLQMSQFAISIILLPMLMHGVIPTAAVMNKQHLSVDRSLSDISKLKIDSNQKIYLGETHIWKQMWITKFLGDRPIAFPTPSPYYGNNKFLAQTIPPHSLYLTPSKNSLITEKQGGFSKTIWSNEVYSLKETGERPPVEITPDRNWNIVEKSWVKDPLSDEFCWLQQDATLKILKHLPTVSRAELELKFVTLLPQTTAEFYVNNQLLIVHLIQSLKPYRLSIPLSEKTTVLKIHVQEGAIIPPNDHRSIAVGVSSIRFTSQ
jgi:hypothetical protein